MMRRLFETVGVIDLYSDIYRQHSHTGKSRKSSGYCWPTSFKVLEVLFLGEVSSAFLPSKKACWAHQFRYLGVGQQYPSVKSTGRRSPPQSQPGCRTTHARV